MRPHISITTTESHCSSQHSIHRRVRGQGRASRLEPLTQLGLQVAGHRDHDRGGREMRQMIDELELLFWSQRGLKNHHLVRAPGAAAGVPGADPLDRDSEPPGGRPGALGEQKVVLDHEQASSHGCRIAG